MIGESQGDAGGQGRCRPLPLIGDGLHPIQRLAEPGEGEPQRMPCLAEAYRPTQARVAVAADPDRYPPAAVVLVVVPGGTHRPEVIVGQRPALLERNSECGELLPRPTDAHAEDQPSPAELVQVGGHASDEQWVPVRHDERRGPKPDPVGDAGQPGQSGKGFVERRRVLLGHVGCHRNVV